jgi:hypothetical protein
MANGSRCIHLLQAIQDRESALAGGHQGQHSPEHEQDASKLETAL